MMKSKLTAPAKEPKPAREPKPPKPAKAPAAAGLGPLALRLSGLFATGGLCVAMALVGAVTGVELLLILGAVLGACVMAAGAVLAPSWLDTEVRQPLATLAASMVQLTPESAATIIKLSERSDGVGEVARASIAAFERQDAASQPAPMSPELEAMLREMQRATEGLRQAQNQMAQGIVATADEIETLRQTVNGNHTQLADSLARTAMEALRAPVSPVMAAAPAMPAGLAQAGERIVEAAAQLSREAQAVQSQRALLAAQVETLGKDHAAALRSLEQQARTLGPDGHNVVAALVDIADRRLSFAETVANAHATSQRLEDLLKRLEVRDSEAGKAPVAVAALPLPSGLTVADMDAVKSAIEGLAPKIDETLQGVKLLGRSLPEAAQLITSGIEGVEAAVHDTRAALEERLASAPTAAAMADAAALTKDHPALADISRSAELFQQVIAVNTASIAEFQTAFDNMRYDVNALRESFLPVVKDVQNTLDRSVEALAALERVSVDVSDVQKAVLPMVEEVKGAMDRTVEALAALERVSVDVGDVQKAILPMVSDVQSAMDRTVETLAALERVSADVDRPVAATGQAATPQPLVSIQPELDQAQKLLVGLRIVIRNLGDEVDVLREKVSAIEAPMAPDLPASATGPAALAPEAMAELAGRFDQIDERLSALAAQVAEQVAAAASARPMPAAEILAPMPDLGAEQMSFQRLLAGFRVLMRNISQESERLQESVSRLSQDAHDLSGAAGPQSERLEKLIGGMGDMVAELGQRLRDAAHAPVSAAARAPMGPHVFDAQQAGFERVLVGFRLLMRDLGQEADKLRGALAGVDALPASAGAGDGALIQRVDEKMSALAGSFEGLLGELEARVSSPLSVAAENIAFAVAETLSSLEQRLAEPVHQMADAARDCRALLAEVKHQLAASLSASPTASAAAATGDPGQRIQAVTTRLDRWIEQVDGTLGELSEDLAATADASSPAVQRALDQRISALNELAAQMRKETSEFVAVGAAISRDLEERDGLDHPRRAAAGGMGGLFPRRKK